ncbi:uncharacterized protein LOC126285114 [Schistocerca gregaria]|uniref:uncharacterized protein LOC126285114 n=1 Tax=Schistocerca gregaria TaxID=7010 RepID=UPI00211F1FCA|nr:uncharacterized protein LOC126285114 [Schistocerca gregaria]
MTVNTVTQNTTVNFVAVVMDTATMRTWTICPVQILTKCQLSAPAAAPPEGCGVPPPPPLRQPGQCAARPRGWRARAVRRPGYESPAVLVPLADNRFPRLQRDHIWFPRVTRVHYIAETDEICGEIVHRNHRTRAPVQNAFLMIQDHFSWVQRDGMQKIILHIYKNNSGALQTLCCVLKFEPYASRCHSVCLLCRNRA